MDKNEITGIVLAGGKSSRMGTDKSLIVWKGKTLLEHAIDILKPLCGKVIISSNNIKDHSIAGCEVWKDNLILQAPIVGIYSCLQRSETNLNIVLSCDMPFVDTSLFDHLIGECSEFPVCVPVHDNDFIEPLCGVYKKSILACMEKFIQGDQLGLLQFIRENKSGIIQIHEGLPFYRKNLFTNINTPDDLKKIQQY